MANHNLPTLTSTYANFVSELDARMDDISMGFDPALTTATNLATGAIRWTSSGSKWEKWSGTAWANLASVYSIDISGNAGTVTNGVYTSGSYSNPAWLTGLAGSKISGDISGNAGSATKLATARNINGVAFDGSSAISINTNNALTLSSAGSGSASGTTFTGASAVTISYDSIGAPSKTGTGASGTWDINISGNAATATTASSVTNGVYTSTDQTVGGIKYFSSQIKLKDGSAVSPSISFNSDTDTGIYWGGDGVVSFTSNGTYAGQIQSNGNLVMVGDITAFSDRKLKTDLVRIEYALDKVDQLTGYVYTRIDNGVKQTGLIAQDIQKVLPEAVKDGDVLSVAYGNMMGLIVEAIKELRSEVNVLKNKYP